MKNLLSISFLLIFNFSFSQVDKKTESFLEIPLFENNIEESHFVVKKQALDFFSAIIKLEVKETKSNSEGKFTLNSKSKIFFNKTIEDYTNSMIDKKNVEKSSNLTTKINKEFVDKIIRKKIAEEIQNYLSINEALTYGDRNIDLYINYDELENKLVKSYPISSDVDIQIGKDIYPYLNKILKTELDKTLQNSLNLLAINF